MKSIHFDLASLVQIPQVGAVRARALLTLQGTKKGLHGKGEVPL